MAEVGELLWPFVLRAAHMRYSDLCDTPEYDAMCDAVHCDATGGLLHLTRCPHVAPPANPWALPLGVDWDEGFLRYSFADVNVMFNTLPGLLCSSCPDNLREALAQCCRRIASTLLVLEAAEDLGACVISA